MKICHTGGIIAAASKKVAKPFLQVGAIPIIRRIVITYQQAGIFPIVIITGSDNEEIKQQLTSYGVIFLKNEQDEQPELFESVKIGLSFLRGKCDRVVFTPVNVPMFTPTTLETLMQSEGSVVTPAYEGRGGHPVLISDDVIDQILAYQGDNGLRGAFEMCPDHRRINVDDKGIICSVYNEADLQARLKEHNSAILHPVMHMQLEKETPFFNARLKLLLFLLHDTQNMRTSCAYSGIAYSKAWDMINTLERNLAFSVVERRRGGTDGGRTSLTERGANFLLAYQHFEENMHHIAQTTFFEQFILTKIL